jgi:hypothetical protein
MLYEKSQTKQLLYKNRHEILKPTIDESDDIIKFFKKAFHDASPTIPSHIHSRTLADIPSHHWNS